MDYHWPTTRDHAIRAFKGETPGPDMEATILEHFEAHPSIVVRAINNVAEDLHAGRIQTGWGILRARLAAANRPAAEITVSQSRDDAVQQAERYIHNAGLHYDRWHTELEDELFGDRGRLRTWSDDTALRDRMYALWLERRPDGITVEQHQTEDSERHREQRAAVLLERERQRTEGETKANQTLQQMIDEANARATQAESDADEPF